MEKLDNLVMESIDTLKSIVFPQFCIICGDMGENLCEKCADKLQLIDFPLCIVCDNLCINGVPHKKCKKLHTPDFFYSPFVYNKISKEVVLKAKYGPRSFTILKALLHHPFSIKIIKEIGLVDLIIPIPMSKTFFSNRLANHSRYIADEIHKLTGHPVYDILEKNFGTKSQKDLDGDLRRRYMDGKIKLIQNFKKFEVIDKKSILLVDDVTTTGTTIMEATKVLKQNGASKVFCYTLTKDLLHNV